MKFRSKMNMKKILYFGMTLCLAMMGFTSCSDEEYTDTTLTYYVDLQILGDEFTLVPLGTPYEDAGCTAELQGEDYTSQLIVEGIEDIDVNTVGFYDVTYSAVNADGYAISASRTVCVYDPDVTVSLAGEYEPDMNATGYGTNGRTFADYAASYGFTSQCTGITFEEVVPGIYYVNDLFGGWYNEIRGYGSKYVMTGYVNLDPDNNIHLLSSYISTWGDGLDELEGTYDPETKTISYSLSYAGVVFIDLVYNFVKELE